MENYALYTLVSQDFISTLGNKPKLNLAIGVYDSTGLIYKLIQQQDISPNVDMSWTDKFAMQGNPEVSTRNVPLQLDISYEQVYDLDKDGTASVKSAPDCPTGSFWFSTAIEAQAKLFEFINQEWVQVYSSPSVKPEDSPFTIRPTQYFKVWISDDGGNKTPDFALDFTGLRSQIISYSESGWALVGPSAYTIGGIFGVTQTDKGFIVTQEANAPTLLMPPIDGVKERLSLSWSFGPIKVEGYINTSGLEIGVSITVLGANIGQFYGNLNDGLVIQLNLLIAKGMINFYLRSPTEVCVKVQVDALGIGFINIDQKILDIPSQA